MDLAAFKETLTQNTPPDKSSLALQALWWDAKDDWERAHQCAQDEPGVNGAWVHAYLHRKKGDHSNAGYWYSRAGKPVSCDSLDEEWARITQSLLQNR